MAHFDLPSATPPGAAAPADPGRAARDRHWRRTQGLTAALLGVWFVVGFGVTWFARELDFPFFGWPFSFWVAAQGASLVFVALLAAYAWAMRRHDRRLRRDVAPPTPSPAGR